MGTLTEWLLWGPNLQVLPPQGRGPTVNQPRCTRFKHLQTSKAKVNLWALTIITQASRLEITTASKDHTIIVSKFTLDYKVSLSAKAMFKTRFKKSRWPGWDSSQITILLREARKKVPTSRKNRWSKTSEQIFALSESWIKKRHLTHQLDRWQQQDPNLQRNP